MRGPILALALAVGTVLGAAASAQSPDAAQLVVRLQALQEEVALLRGEVEELRHRVRQLEARGPVASPSPAAQPEPPGPLPGGGGTLGGGSPGPATVLDRPALEPGFERGMALLQSGRFAEGRAELDGFVKDNPSDPRAAEAAFWAADSLFVQGDYAAAAAAFAANYRAFGAEAPFATDSLLKVAMALVELGDSERACQTLNELARRHDDLGRSLADGVARTRARANCR